jgi:hypothetical protein
MMKHLAVAALSIGSMGVPADAQPSATIINVAAMNPGEPPPDFEFAHTGQGKLGQWVVVEEPSAQGGRAIAQTSGDPTDYRFPLAIFTPVSAKDVEVSVRFKPVSGKVDQAGGIAVRLASPDNYYVVRANALEDNVRFYRVVAGKREQLAGAAAKVASNQWHTLGLKAEGARFTVSFDGKQLFTAQDQTFSDAGRVALWTKADSITHFDSIGITPLQ